jgi:hypothetical protein
MRLSEMRLWKTRVTVIFFVGAAVPLGALANDATDRPEAKRHQPSAIQKFTTNPYYCNQMLGDQDSGDSLSAEFSKGLVAALKETRKPIQLAVQEIQSLCEKRILRADTAKVNQKSGR